MKKLRDLYCFLCSESFKLSVYIEVITFNPFSETIKKEMGDYHTLARSGKRGNNRV